MHDEDGNDRFLIPASNPTRRKGRNAYGGRGRRGRPFIRPRANDLRGGSGNDKLIGTAKRDRLFGGGGEATSSRTAEPTRCFRRHGPRPRHLRHLRHAGLHPLNGLADHGGAGENDWVHSDVEQARGGKAGDKLIGTAAMTLSGRPGDDYRERLGGADHVLGGAGTGRAGVDSPRQHGQRRARRRGGQCARRRGGDARRPVSGTRSRRSWGECRVGPRWRQLDQPGCRCGQVDAGEGADSITTTDGEVDWVVCGAGTTSRSPTQAASSRRIARPARLAVLLTDFVNAADRR